MRFNFTPFQILVHLASLSQFALLVFDFFTDNLTVNPIQYVTQKTGKAALTLLCLSLACTPAITLGFKSAAKVRRPLGVYACLYASFHFLTFVGLDYGFDLGLIYEAIFKKPYALVGFSAFLILLPMALTSNARLDEATRQKMETPASLRLSRGHLGNHSLLMARQIRYS